MNSLSKLQALPFLGTGLSTDLYFPPLAELLNTLDEHDLRPDFIEVFRGRTEDLKHARERIVPPSVPMTYHGDALWYTDSAFQHHPAYRRETCRANRHLDATGSPWMIHECARKSLSGRTFGYYIPPALEISVARMTRKNALMLESRLEGRALLLEIPPFPFFSLGQLDCGTFFRTILEGTSLGMGLDIGHALTAFSIDRTFFSPDRFACWIRDTFPLEHVVEIHVGGLSSLVETSLPPFWDDHRVPVPDILWESFEAVLGTCSFPSLKAIALEVDNKNVASIVSEFGTFRTILHQSGFPDREEQNLLSENNKTRQGARISGNTPEEEKKNDGPDVEVLDRILLETLLEGKSPSPDRVRGNPALYRERIYTEEIWEFGGHLPDMFPRTIEFVSGFVIDARADYVSFFHRVAWTDLDPYDYLRTKTVVTRMWVEHLVQTGSLDGEAAEYALETVRKEAQQILFDQDAVNGDPCPMEDGDRRCPSCNRPFEGIPLSGGALTGHADGVQFV